MAEKRWVDTNSFKNFKMRELKSGRFRVMINKGDFEGLVVKREKSDRLYIVLSGSRDPEKNKWPFFQHADWKDALDGHVVYVADPTLHHAKNLKVGWYVGTKEYDWLNELSKLVEYMANELEIPKSGIFPIGAAAGGFAALMLAAKLSGSTAIAINPQTNVLFYHKKFVNELMDECFDGVLASRITADVKDRLSAINVYKNNIFARAVILQNKQNKHNYQKHFIPFCDTLNIPRDGGLDPTARIQVILNDEIEKGFNMTRMLPILVQRAAYLSGSV